MPLSLQVPARRAVAGLVCLVLTCGCSRGGETPAPNPVETADRIFLDARIWTGDGARPRAEALAVRDGIILATGNEAEAMAYAGPGTRIESLGGLRMLPGFHDAHWHLPSRPAADLAGAADVEELIQRLREYAKVLPGDAWLVGRGWTPDMFPDHTAHHHQIDAAFPGRPVVITDRDGHQSLANGVALALAGIDAETPDPAGGEITRDRTGKPTGLLKETAMDLVRSLLPPLSGEEIYGALQRTMDQAARLGLTSLQIAHAPGAAEAAAYRRALADDTLKVRLRLAVPFSQDASDADLERFTELATQRNDPFLRYGIAKGMLDGTVDGATAAMLAPFHQHESAGIAMWEQQALDRMVARYDEAGIQVQLHAIGDRAIRMALDAFENAARVNGPRDRRHRVEHVEVTDAADLPRFVELGVIASMQPIFATPDSTTLESYAPMLGPDLAARANDFRSFEAAGVTLAFGSDYPVFPMDPLLGIYTAVTRQTPDGVPPDGWYPENRISLGSALRHYTWGSAYAAFREHELGILAPGMLADFVVLSEDILEGPPARLLSARPLLTVMGGRDTYRDDMLAPAHREPVRR